MTIHKSYPTKKLHKRIWENEKKFYFGDIRKCKLVFVSDKNTDTKNTGLVLVQLGTNLQKPIIFFRKVCGWYKHLISYRFWNM